MSYSQWSQASPPASTGTGFHRLPLCYSRAGRPIGGSTCLPHVIPCSETTPENQDLTPLQYTTIPKQVAANHLARTRRILLWLPRRSTNPGEGRLVLGT